MRAVILAAVALLPAPALAVPVQYHCTGTAEGVNGERVEVVHYYSVDGKPEGRSANWDPPRRLEQGADSSADLTFSLLYDQPTQDDPGASFGATVIAMAFAPPGSRGTGAVQRRLDGAAAELVMDDGSARRVAMERDARIADLPMTAMRFASLDPLPETTRDLAMRLLDRRSRVLAAARFDLSDSARRDGLYREAWTKAEEAGRDPAQCPAAEE